MAIDTSKKRGPSDLRNALEPRVRRQARTYSDAVQLESLREIVGLCAIRILDLEEKLGLQPGEEPKHD